MECINCNQQAISDSDYCSDCEKKIFSKIGGWLWIPLFSLAVTAILLVVVVVRDIQVVFESYSLLENKLKFWIVYESVIKFIFFVASIYISGLFFRRKRMLPVCYIYFIIALIIYEVSDIWVANNYLQLAVDVDDIKRIAQRLIHAAIWIPYFLVSARVKRTFIK